MKQRINNYVYKLRTSETSKQIYKLLKDKYFYIGLATLIAGIELNFHSQKYLLEHIESGKSLPVLSDLILDNIPYWDIDFLYDIGSILSVFILIYYIIHKQKLHRLPYILLLSGIFQIIRGFFIVLTPFGNPAGFNGTDGLFNGFSKIELGVYPSGHTGIAFLFFLLVREKPYRHFLLSSVLLIIFALFMSRGHYTIDILSGIFFAYAIKSFSDKYLLRFFDPKSYKDYINSIFNNYH